MFGIHRRLSNVFLSCIPTNLEAPTDLADIDINGATTHTAVQLTTHVKSSTLYDRTSKFFRLDGLLLFCVIMGLRSASSAIIILGDLYQLPPICQRLIFKEYKNGVHNLCYPWLIFVVT